MSLRFTGGDGRTTPYGAWSSPIDAASIATAGVGLGSAVLDGDDIYWLEHRPVEAGRVVIVRYRNGSIEDLLPAPYNARNSVHEYGGGAYAVHRGRIFFVNFPDHGLYELSPGAPPRRIDRDGEHSRRRYADLQYDARRQRLICVCEDHGVAGEAKASLVAIALADGTRQVLAEGADFYASPSLDAGAGRCAWLSWQHPLMPWDGAELWRADFTSNGALGSPRRVAGGSEESIFQPQWGADGRLYYVSDRSDWWNLYRDDDGRPEALAPQTAECGLPQWVFGMSTYGFCDDGSIVCATRRDGGWQLQRLRSTANGYSEPEPVPTPYCDIDGLRVSGRRAVFVGATPSAVGALVALDLDSGDALGLRSSSTLELDPDYLSTAEAIRFESGGVTAHAFYYSPCNPEHRAPPGERPPLVVRSHGGPTASTSPALQLGIQFWTSRGFAVVDVNYRGSVGYGRRYRQALYRRWGVADVEDCIAAARYLIDDGRVDPARCAIRGNSAGGYTTLAALTFSDLFSAGASYYGISDLEILARDTHKFESRYLDQLIGPYPAERERYRARSPIHHSKRLNAPVIFFQGMQDRVVPPNQAELMAQILRDKGLPVALITYAEEGHGFRQAENIEHALNAEWYFYSRLFGFTPADFKTSPPVVIDNLELIS